MNKRLSAIVKVFRYLLPLLCMGIFAVIFLPRLALEDVKTVLQEMNPVIVLVAAAAQTGSYLGSGYMLSTIMAFGHVRVTVGRGALITVAAASLGLVAGGWVSQAAAIYYWISRDRKSSENAALAAVLPALYNTSMLLAVSLLGAAYLLLNHSLSHGQMVFYGAVLAFTTLLFLIMLLGVVNRQLAQNMLTRLAGPLGRLTHQAHFISKASQRLDRFYDEIAQMRHGRWIKPSLGAAVNVGLDILTLYLFFAAAGYFIRPGVLVAGYSIALLLARSAFFIPGGAGVVEGGLVAVYANLGVSGHIAVIAVLGYRLLSFWLPSLLGFIAMFFFQRSAAGDRR